MQAVGGVEGADDTGGLRILHLGKGSPVADRVIVVGKRGRDGPGVGSASEKRGVVGDARRTEANGNRFLGGLKRHSSGPAPVEM